MKRNGNHPARQKREGCIGTKAPNRCESSGAKYNRARMFLTRYLVNARHPRAESFLKKFGENIGPRHGDDAEDREERYKLNKWTQNLKLKNENVKK